jgi:hypothetical protein
MDYKLAEAGTLARPTYLVCRGKCRSMSTALSQTVQKCNYHQEKLQKKQEDLEKCVTHSVFQKAK